MRKIFLSLSLILMFSPVFANETGENFEHNVAATITTGHRHYPGCGGWGRRPYYGYNSGIWRNPFSRWNRGAITGFTPPINYGYGWNSPGYGYNSYYSTSPYMSNNVSLGTKIRRFFNPHYYNTPIYNPTFNPHINGNYNNLNNQKHIPLFNNGSGINGGSVSGNGFGLDDDNSSSGGATVTIID